MQKISVEFDRDVDQEKIKTIHGLTELQPAGPNRSHLFSPLNKDIRSEVFRFAVENNVTVINLNLEENKLESIFRNLTQEKVG